MAQETAASCPLSLRGEQDAALKECLDFVADRETSHYYISKRRIRELGFELVEEAYPDFSEQQRLVSSDISDSEKIRRLKDLEQLQPKPTIRDRYAAATDDMRLTPCLARCYAGLPMLKKIQAA